MSIHTNWISPPVSTGGLDHLGTQAPCLLIYAQLLPGITNVTNRARYYSFYPWLVWSFDQRYAKDEAKFVEFFRRADCLFTLAAERHSRQTDHDSERHGIAMVGREKLLKALDALSLGKTLRLSTFATREETSSFRYFKSKLGGLSQYYAGTLVELKLLDATAKPWMRYTTEYGLPLAENLDHGCPSDRFWEIVENDEVELADLDELERFCSCNLRHSVDENATLTAIYFDRAHAFEEEGVQRKKTLGLILNLAAALPDGHDLDESLFRACTYSGSLPGQVTWPIPQTLELTKKSWGVYQRNDMLSVAFQAILGISLKAISPQDAVNKVAYPSIEQFARAFSNDRTVTDLTDRFAVDTFAQLVDGLADSAPDISHWEDTGHEVQMAGQMMQAWSRDAGTGNVLELACRLIALLAFRDDLDYPAYGGIAMSSEALANYPINLVSFRTRVLSWRAMKLADFVSDIVAWCLNTHLRVALRKLNQTGRSTFHLRPAERGIEVVGDVPPPAHTTPRFEQAVQILRDIGALTRDGGSSIRKTRLSELGSVLMEEASA